MDWDPPETWTAMKDFLSGLGREVGTRPRAILVISAHWEEPVFTVTSHPAPPLLFDYYGFPEHTYKLTYAAPGAPDLAAEIRGLLAKAGLPSAENKTRGFDHGVFIPFMLTYPKADIPIVQLSLMKGLDPAEHLALGRALAPLRHKGVLIAGSGMSYHNLREFFRTEEDRGSQAFDDWLTAAAEAPGKERNALLTSWEDAPFARACHPREEHLLPLMVAAGAAEAEAGKRIFRDTVMGHVVSGHRFG
jgi:aromatic ring-opening dioxygenase catalytic subunit (LigB family)